MRQERDQKDKSREEMRMYRRDLERLENRVNNGDATMQMALKETRSKLHKLKDIELEESALFLANGGQGK